MKNTHTATGLSRRRLLQGASALLAGGLPAWGDEFDGAPSTHEQLRSDARKAPLSMRFEGSTAEELAAWRKAFSAKLRDLLGPHVPPRKWETVVEDRKELEGHVRERIVLKADGHPTLPLYRLLPRPLPAGRRPGLLAIHGHGGVFGVVGKDDEPGIAESIRKVNYDYGRRLAIRGYVVVAPCMTPFRPREEKAPYRGEDPCAVTMVRMQLLGKVLMAENLRDCLWAFEMLAQDPRVDAERLGCLGLSYGGRMTMLTAALEPRIKVAAVSGALNVMQERIAHRYSCGAQVIPGLLKYGDIPEIGSLIAPRPCVWEWGSKDGLIDTARAEDALKRMRKAYAASGAPDALKVDRFEGGHRWNGKVAEPLFEKLLGPDR